MKSSCLAELATGRKHSLFRNDLAAREAEVRSKIDGRRILVIGGAGSIGSATVRELCRYTPQALHVLDISENNLVELVRELRGASLPLRIADFRALPVDFGTEVCHRLLLEQPPYDFVLNFAALKHVRSEKDVYSLLQMLDTNIVKQVRLLRWLGASGCPFRFFSVSTDKAANPVNLMGASKRFMEHVIFSARERLLNLASVTSARFANVAFSDGSLLFGWLQRLGKCQPLAVPANTRRYFISLEEAGELCLLASVLGQDGHILIPKLDAEKDLQELLPLARRFLEAHGYTPREYRDEAQAKQEIEARRGEGGYPLLVTTLDTSGEKAFEEFVGDGERSVEIGMRRLQGVPYSAGPEDVLPRVLRRTEQLVSDPTACVSKEAIVAILAEAVPQFQHAETGKCLDERL
jgi:FlaA1/EpsC-like NDP-sugar epimerase